MILVISQLLVTYILLLCFLQNLENKIVLIMSYFIPNYVILFLFINLLLLLFFFMTRLRDFSYCHRVFFIYHDVYK